MNKQEKPILHNSSTDKLVININGKKTQNGNTFCCLRCSRYFIMVACALKKCCPNDTVLGYHAVNKVKERKHKNVVFWIMFTAENSQLVRLPPTL